ncbi:MAG: hypothetical protein V2A76_06440 [Planctomycetota bacterium]
MKRAFLAILTLSAGALLTPSLQSQSQDREKLRQKLIEKFDENGDGKLDQAERGKARSAIAEKRQNGRAAQKKRLQGGDAGKQEKQGRRGKKDRPDLEGKQGKRLRPGTRGGPDGLDRRALRGRQRDAGGPDRLGVRRPGRDRAAGPGGFRTMRSPLGARARRPLQGDNRQRACGQRRGIRPGAGPGQGQQGCPGCCCRRNNEV